MEVEAHIGLRSTDPSVAAGGVGIKISAKSLQLLNTFSVLEIYLGLGGLLALMMLLLPTL